MNLHSNRALWTIALSCLFLLTAHVLPAHAQTVSIDAHLATGSDTSYFGVPLNINFNLNASETDFLEAFWFPMVMQFSNGNLIGPFDGVGYPVVVWQPAGATFESIGVGYKEASDPDTLTVSGISLSAPHYTGAASVFVISALPLDTGTIQITTDSVSPDGYGWSWCRAGDFYGELPIAFNSPTIVVEPCPAAVMGDANNDGAITSADIIYLVIYVFRSGPEPLPVRLAGDADCNRHITSADIVYLAAYIFRSGPVPCPCTYTG